MILLTVLTMPVIAGGVYCLVSGPQLFGLVLLVLVATVLLWLWKPWVRDSKA